jgi:hypothetical protein
MRKSTRVEREIPVLLTSLDPRQSVCTKCHTVTINAHGCGVRLEQRIAPGTGVFLDLLTEERQAKGRVVDAVSLDNAGTDWLIGIEFAKVGNFWGLSDPPLDWGAAFGHEPPTNFHPQGHATTHPERDDISTWPVRLTDLSPFACYVESDRTLPLLSSVEVDFQVEQLRIRRPALVKLEHPNTGMGLQLAPGNDHTELHLLIKLLIAGGQAASLESTVHHSQRSANRLVFNPPADESASQDSLLLLILSPDSHDAQRFLEALRRQRLR